MKKVYLVTVILIWALALSFGYSALVGAREEKPDEKELKQILLDFEEYAERIMNDWDIPGMAVSIVQDDKVIYARGFGVKKIGGSDPVDEHTIFQIGSTSKAFTTVMIAMLVDKEKLDWKDKIIDHLPSFQLYDPWVTREFMLDDLMAQHSGLHPYSGDLQAFFGFDRNHIIHSLRYLRPVTSFRSEFGYQNNLFLVAAALIEKYSGRSWEDNLKRRILKPLGMTETTATLKGFKKTKNVSALHQKQDGKVFALPDDWLFLDWVYTYAPAGGINSNVIDMAKWLALHINDGEFKGKRLVSVRNINYTHTPKTIIESEYMGDRVYYGEAWLYDSYFPYPIVWHNGGTSGMHSIIAMIPEAKVGLVVLTNLQDSKVPEVLSRYFADLYFGNPRRDWSREELAKERKAEEEKETPEKTPSSMPPLSLEDYTGDYHNDIYETINISKEGEFLFMTIGPKKAKMRLKPWYRDNFHVTPPLGLDTEDWDISFQVDADGEVDTLTIDVLNEDGNSGIFKTIED